MRPHRPWTPVLGSLGAGVGWEVVAHNGGAGWVQALGDVLLPALLVGLVGPAVVLARARLELRSHPADAVTGSPCTVAVWAGTRLRVRPVVPAGPEAFVGPGLAKFVLVPEWRGVHDRLELELATAAPFGLLWWRRRVTVSLAQPLMVAPRAGEPFAAERIAARGRGDADSSVRGHGGGMRAVRDYHSGDTRRSVHWPVTAHRGALVVKETDALEADPVLVRAALPVDADDAERVAGRALGTVAELLRRGASVVLSTDEATGRRVEPVTDRRQAAHRLARATSPGGAVVSADRTPAGTEEPPPASMWERVKRANRPGEPEHSVVLRLTTGAAVLIGIGAVRSQGEVSMFSAVAAAVLLVTGMTVSYRTRNKPLGWAKVPLALGALAAFVWFFEQLAGQPFADVSTVEDPLAVLFVVIQVLHAFDVPARRDLAFSLAGSATLMAVAAAQATDMSFGLYALAWIVAAGWALLASGAAAMGGRLGRRRQPVAVGAAVAVLALVALLVLPAPRVGGAINFPLDPGGGASLASPLGLAGDGATVSEPARPGTPAGRSRVGGFTGFALRLDTALRPSADNTLVMRVRSQYPSYWVGETFDQWTGQSWLASSEIPRILQNGSPYDVAPLQGGPLTGPSDLQTFYVVQSTPNLVFHAENAAQLWFPARSVFVRPDGTIVSPIGLGPGAIYTVRSSLVVTDPAQLRSADGVPPTTGMPSNEARLDTSLPHAYPAVAALVRRVTAGAPTTYDNVEALIGWIGSHTRYSLDIPPLGPGQDAVDQFLFGTRVGFCEQISTALAVMLRTEGIPAREVAGFVPGSYNPLTDLYEVRASDAHAWVEVWFPGYGWQGFDPTASVPLANPDPGVTLVHEAGHVLGRLPWAPVGVVSGIGAALWAVATWRRRRPRDWMERAVRRMERAGRRARRPRRPAETLTEYARALDDLSAEDGAAWGQVADLVESAAYGPGSHPS